MESEQRRPLVAFAAEDLGHGRDRHGRLDSVVLPRLTLALHEGERVALLGQSGSGKSTLLAELRERLGRRAAWCPQHHGLVPALAVYHNVYMGRLPEHSALANLWNLVRPLRQPWREVEALCEQLGLAGLLRRPVGRLSGGQRQRVAIARALYQGRALFLGDEPVASVDPHQALRLLALIDARHTTQVVALHQRELALTHFDRVWGLRDGRLVIDAPSRDLRLADLDALYPDADAPAGSPREAATPAMPGPEALPCARGRPASSAVVSDLQVGAALRAGPAMSEALSRHPHPGHGRHWWRGDSTGLKLARHTLALVALAVLLMPFADLAIHTREPWTELGRMALGMAWPAWGSLESPLTAIGLTVAVAIWGTLAGVVLGFPLALLFARSRLVRAGCAFVRAIHELFWALLFLQVFGLSALTALAALAIPYAGIFAKVYAEILEQAPRAPRDALPPGSGRLSRFVYAELPLAWAQLVAYTRYRFECALRASVLLGFVGLPTLGFHLETAFREGRYHEAGALLWLFYLLIASLPWWGHRRLVPVLLVGGAWLLGPWPSVDGALLWRFVSEDIWPPALLAGDWAGLTAWLSRIPALGPAIGNTLLLGLLGTVGALAVALLLWPLASRHFGNRASRLAGRGLLVALRSTPELMLAFLFLLLLGPSLLPAWLALALHNGALIAFLVARHADALAPGMPGLPASGRYAYELLPRLYPGMLALLYYRAEVILRETAILGMLGVATLGFYIEEGFDYLLFDVAFFLLLVTAALNIAVDALSRRLRPREAPIEDPCSR